MVHPIDTTDEELARFSSYGGKPALLEAYLVFVQSIERTIDRRQSTHKFYLSITSAIAAAFGYSISYDGVVDSAKVLAFQNALLVSAFFISIVWLFNTLKFRESSKIKFATAIHLEEALGIECISIEERLSQKMKGIIDFTLIEVIFPMLIGILAVLTFLFI